MNSKTEKTVQQKIQNGGSSTVALTDFTCSSSGSIQGAGHCTPLKICSSPAFARPDPATFHAEPSTRQQDSARDVGLLLRKAGDELYRSYTGRRVVSPCPPTSSGRQLAAVADEFNAEQEWKNTASDFVHVVAAAAIAGFLTGLVVKSFLQQ